MTAWRRRLRPVDATFLPRARAWLPALVVSVGLLVLLSLFVAADPAPGLTSSTSPWTDEAWNALGARNLVLLGHFSTDQWNLYLLEAPFSLLLAAVFGLFGVGIVQARLLCIGFVALTPLALGLGLRRPLGTLPAAIAALALATSELILYYGRLVYLEDLVILALTAGALTLVPATARPGRWGLVGGAALALAIGTKASAILPAAGLVGGVAVYAVVTDRRLLRWVAGAVLVVLAAGLAWGLLVYLPHRAEVADDMLILAPVSLPGSIGQLLAQLRHLPHSDGLWRHTWPLAVAGTAGGLLALSRREARRGVGGALLFAALGWLAVGGGAYALITYQPNRYLVPLLPALAILVACGAAAAMPWVRAMTGTMFRTAILASVVVVLAAPGLTSYAGWMRSATYSLPTMQAQVLPLVPSGAVSFGAFAPAMLMRAPVVTIARTVGGQAGTDVYVTRGVRWFVTIRDEAVQPVASAHPGPWGKRTAVYCSPWRGSEICLYRVP